MLVAGRRRSPVADGGSGCTATKTRPNMVVRPTKFRTHTHLTELGHLDITSWFVERGSSYRRFSTRAAANTMEVVVVAGNGLHGNSPRGLPLPHSMILSLAPDGTRTTREETGLELVWNEEEENGMMEVRFVCGRRTRGR
ncbi:hypothetical protein LXL04_019446 [Taraxacum kok-saghyz]